MKCCSVTLQGAIHACATLPLCSHATQLTVFGSLLQKSKIVILLDNFSLAKTDAKWMVRSRKLLQHSISIRLVN